MKRLDELIASKMDPLDAAEIVTKEASDLIDKAVLHIENTKEYMTLDAYWAKYIIKK